MDLRKTIEELKDIDMCTSQRDAGVLFGRTESWVSSTLSRNREVTVECWLKFVLSLEGAIECTLEGSKTEQDPVQKQAYSEGYVALNSLKERAWNHIWKRLEEK